MTHSIDAPFPPPPTAAGTRPGATTESTWSTGSGNDTGSTKDIAKNEAAELGQTTAQAGSQVASTAADQAREVAQETQQQARNLLDQGRSQLQEQAGAQQQKAAQGLSSLAGELRGMVNGTGTSSSGPAHDLVQQATDKIEDLAGWLQHREPAQLLDEVRSYARRKPGTFLLGAALAGVVAGRLTRGVQAAHSGNGSTGQHRSPATAYPQTRYAQNVVEPSGTYPSPAAPSLQSSGIGQAAASRPVPPPPYGTVPPAEGIVPPAEAAPAGWDDPARRPGEVR